MAAQPCSFSYPYFTDDIIKAQKRKELKCTVTLLARQELVLTSFYTSCSSLRVNSQEPWLPPKYLLK